MLRENIEQLAGILSRIEDSKTVERFLLEILTPSEIDAIVLRWELLKLLNEGVSQREISNRLGISLCKITRGSKVLKKQGSAVKKILDTYS